VSIKLKSIYLFIFSLLVLLPFACSNFLIDPRIDPDSDPVPSELTVILSASIEEGEDSAYGVSQLTLEWSEEILDFTIDDIDITNGSVSSLNHNGNTVSFSLTAVSSGSVGFSIPADRISSENGLSNSKIDYNFIYHPDALALVITSTESSVTNLSPIPLTFQFSESVEDFQLSDISTTLGTVENLSGSGSLYSADLLPGSDGTAEIAVIQGAATDSLTGVAQSEAAVFSITYDGTSPGVSLTGPIEDGGIAGFNTLTFTAHFTEDVTGFSLEDISTVNADLSNLTGSGSEWSFDVTPQNDALVSLNIPADSAIDQAGNGNTALADSYDYTYNSNKVAVNFSSSSELVTNDSTVTITITFDLDMDEDDLAEGELSVSGGSLSNFQKVSDSVYTVDIVSMTDGDVTLTVADGAASRSFGRTNTESSFTFQYDGSAPAFPSFQVLEFISRDVLASDGISNEILEVDLTTDYSGDPGLQFEYTTDNGTSWHPYSDPRYIAAEGLYSGINIRVTDGSGNETEGSALTDITIDTTPPDSPLVNITSDPVNASNYTDFTFGLSGGEAGIDYNYTLSSSGGGTDMTGSGTLDGAGETTVSGLDTTGLNDGTLTLQVTLTDGAGNESGIGQDQTVKDIAVPPTPVLTILSGDPVTSADHDSFGFSVSGGETGAAYEWVVSSDGGGPVISGSGTFDGSGGFSETGLELSALRDGVLTATITQSDSVGNESPAGSDTVELNATAENDSDFAEVVDPVNVGSYSFTITGDPGASWSYTLSSSNGGSTLSDSGTIPGGGTENIGPLNLNGLSDGWLILVLTLTDTLGNSAIEVYVAEKSSIVAETAAVDFSLAQTAVTFDMNYHGTQTVPRRDGGAGTETVKYDTTGFTGSPYDDVIKFSDLQDGDLFTIDGGSGWNVLNLENHLSNDVSVSAGGSGLEDDGSVTIDLGGGESATINYTEIQYIQFSTNNFSGAPHGIEMDTSNNSSWTYGGITARVNSTGIDERNALLDYNGSLGLNFILTTTFEPFATKSNRNGMIIFDYQDSLNYKYVRAFAAVDNWKIIEYVAGVQEVKTVLYETISDTGINDLEVRVTGEEGKTAELWSGGVKKTEFSFDDPLNDGRFGIGNQAADTEFTINMAPSNWAPYVENYDEIVSQSAGNTVTLDLLGDAVDHEGDDLSLVSFSNGNGSLTDNGDGTVTYQVSGPAFYGIDEFTYQVSDGTNTSEGVIRFDVVP
jgi:hypothetical protein